VTAIHLGTSVEISWTAPYDSASPITSYTIFVRHADEVSFSLELSNCDGTDATIISEAKCIIPISVIRAQPYYLDWGQHVYSKVVATNAVGSSNESLEGNGAKIVTVPD
jgi:hypothetical protein